VDFRLDSLVCTGTGEGGRKNKFAKFCYTSMARCLVTLKTLFLLSELESEGKTRACWDKTSHEFTLLKIWRACCSSHGLQISLQHMSLTKRGNKALADNEMSNTPCTFHNMEQHMNHAQNNE
jgi:hypothetical protein